MKHELAEALMMDFATRTGLSGKFPPQRYLWTDSFAVCNFLGLFRKTKKKQYLVLALELVDQVHHTLGKHRTDEERVGWISGLPDLEAEKHPTIGGLRIGKKLNERQPDTPYDPELEWHRDGQYFHYLTRWMHTLFRIGQETGDKTFISWAVELACTAHRAFVHTTTTGHKRIYWKMSIDLSRPLVDSMGQHDPLDGFITCLELQSLEKSAGGSENDLSGAIADFREMCESGHWVTTDALGIGNLLENSHRLATLVFSRDIRLHDLLIRLLQETRDSLQAFMDTTSLLAPASYRLPFREIGLAIGLHGLEATAAIAAGDQETSSLVKKLQYFGGLANQIESFWMAHQKASTWIDHRNINSVMFATALEPEGYYGPSNTPC